MDTSVEVVVGTLLLGLVVVVIICSLPSVSRNTVYFHFIKFGLRQRVFFIWPSDFDL